MGTEVGVARRSRRWDSSERRRATPTAGEGTNDSARVERGAEVSPRRRGVCEQARARGR